MLLHILSLPAAVCGYQMGIGDCSSSDFDTTFTNKSDDLVSAGTIRAWPSCVSTLDVNMNCFAPLNYSSTCCDARSGTVDRRCFCNHVVYDGLCPEDCADRKDLLIYLNDTCGLVPGWVKEQLPENWEFYISLATSDGSVPKSAQWALFASLLGTLVLATSLPLYVIGCQ